MDLETFFMLDDKYGCFKQNSIYITALEGLSGALESIHDLHLNKVDHEVDLSRIGYHHDLRPRNILVTPETFILADFGLSRFKIADAGSRTKWRENMGDYIAPECMDQDFEPQVVGRAIDIWAFGGIIFDLAWHREQGRTGLLEARSARQGPVDRNNWNNQCFFLENQVKPKVVQSSKDLRYRSKEPTTIGLLNMVFSMLEITPERRPSAKEVRRRMTFLQVKSLFSLARERLRICKESSVEQDEYGLPSTKLQMAVARLDAWASILGLADHDTLTHTGFEDALQSSESNIAYIKDVLKDIEETFRNSVVPEDGRNLLDLVVQPITIDYHEERHELLHQLIEKLLKILPPNYRRRVDQLWQQIYISINDTGAHLERSLEIGSTAGAQYEELAVVSSMRALRLGFYEQFRLVGSTGLLLPAECLEYDRKPSGSKYQTGWYRPSEAAMESVERVAIQVLIERIYCPSNITAQSAEERTTRIGALAELLHQTPKPKDFRVLDCIGFIDSGEGFDFLYRFPHAVFEGAKLVPRRLDELLKAGRPAPGIEEKLSLARALVSSIHSLHDAEWLHRNINPTNILFFVPDIENPGIMWDKPYLVNFSHSRPDGDVWVTDGPAPEKDYQHPEYLQKSDSCSRFKKEYDYYSIGVILAEIGIWTPLVDSLRMKGGTPGEFRTILLKEYMPNLRRSLGKRYRNAVRECLDGGKLQDTAATHGLSGFFEYVMEPLFEIQL